MVTKAKTTSKKPTRDEAKEILKASFKELKTCVEATFPNDAFRDLFWIAKTGERTQMRNMQSSHILLAMKSIVSRETADVLQGKNSGPTSRTMFLVLFCMEISARMKSKTKSKDQYDKHYLDAAKELIKELEK